jgi:hypothetical protein
MNGIYIPAIILMYCLLKTYIMNSQTASLKYNLRKYLLIGLGIFILIVLAFVMLEKTNTTDILRMNGRMPSLRSSEKKAETPSKAPTAQSNFTGGSERNTNTTNAPEGIVNDQKGNIETIPQEAEWSRSSDDNLIVYSPARDSLLKNGQVLAGTSKAERIYFRLIDNINGTIAQGSVAVVNGRYSGSFTFTTDATSGQVDVFNQAYDGTESNNVSIPVRFR